MNRRRQQNHEAMAKIDNVIIERIREAIDNKSICLVKLRGQSASVILIFTGVQDISKKVGSGIVTRYLLSAKNLKTNHNHRKFYAGSIMHMRILTQQELLAMSGDSKL